MKQIIKPYEKATTQHIIQKFGVNPMQHQPNGHTGIDFWFAGCFGEKLLSPARCEVVSITTSYEFADNFLPKFGRGFGILLQDLDDAKYQYLLWHCAPVFPVRVGAIVQQGEPVAQLGNSGLSFSVVNGQWIAQPLAVKATNTNKGAHLHFEVREWGKYIDPLPMIDWGATIKYDNISATSKFIQGIIDLIKRRK